MNLTECYSVYDVKAEAYAQPFFAANDAVAERMFGMVVNEKAGPLNQYAADYTLFHIGQFDVMGGFLVPAKTGRPIAKAIELLKGGE